MGLGLVNDSKVAHVLARVELLLLILTQNKLTNNVVVLLNLADRTRLDLANCLVL